jgi:hypothetical protein
MGAEDGLAEAVRPRAEGAQHLQHCLAVMALLGLDDLDALALDGVTDAAPVPLVGVDRGELARTGALKLADELPAGVHSMRQVDGGQTAFIASERISRCVK